MEGLDRATWRETFRTDPHLHFVRGLIGTEHEAVTYETFAGWYNDHVNYGERMTAEQARELYRSAEEPQAA